MTTVLKRSPIRKRRPGTRRGRVINPEYLAFVRTFGCAVCHRGKLVRDDGYWSCSSGRFCILQSSPTEAAHVGDRGLSQKCNDTEALPLCATGHHREGKLSAHVLGKNFWATHGLNRDELIENMQARYQSEVGK